MGRNTGTVKHEYCYDSAIEKRHLIVTALCPTTAALVLSSKCLNINNRNISKVHIGNGKIIDSSSSTVNINNRDHILNNISNNSINNNSIKMDSIKMDGFKIKIKEEEG